MPWNLVVAAPDFLFEAALFEVADLALLEGVAFDAAGEPALLVGVAADLAGDFTLFECVEAAEVADLALLEGEPALLVGVALLLEGVVADFEGVFIADFSGVLVGVLLLGVLFGVHGRLYIAIRSGNETDLPGVGGAGFLSKRGEGEREVVLVCGSSASLTDEFRGE